MGKVNPKSPTFYHKSVFVDNLLTKFTPSELNKKNYYSIKFINTEIFKKVVKCGKLFNTTFEDVKKSHWDLIIGVVGSCLGKLIHSHEIRNVTTAWSEGFQPQPSGEFAHPYCRGRSSSFLAPFPSKLIPKPRSLFPHRGIMW